MAKSVLSYPVYRREIILTLGKLIREEVKAMCSEKADSILRKNDPSSLEHFSWDNVVQEAKVHTPILYSLLEVCISEPEKVHMRGYLVALLCHIRWNNMNLHLKIVSAILYAGHCSKQV